MRKIDLNLTYSAVQHEILFPPEPRQFGIYPKGRRAGITRGAAGAFVEWMLDGKALMWGDTIGGNITRYVDRYFMPILKRLPASMWSWEKQKMILKVGEGFADFRSADRPENWEGFGYHVIFLNEAGIILDDEYLFNNAVMPMLIDHRDSRMIAAGTPKLRHGKGRLFQTLWKRVERREQGYQGKKISSYENPFIDPAQIDKLAASIPEADRAQEIFGEFVEAGGQRIKKEWLRKGRPSEVMIRSMGVDLAISTKTGADYTACVVVDRDHEGRRFIRHAERRRVPFHQVIEFIKEVASKWKPAVIGIEQAQYQLAVIQELTRTTDLPVRSIVPDRDKIARFMPLEVRYEQGLVIHDPDLAPQFDDELLMFPAGNHDDQVDALALADIVAGRAMGTIEINESDYEEIGAI